MRSSGGSSLFSFPFTQPQHIPMKSPAATVTMPLFVMLPRKTMPDRKYILNLNAYRNWKPIVSNFIKIAYCQVAAPRLKGLRFDNPIHLRFTLFTPTKRRIDRANPLCIHEKFFCDAMVHAGVIDDDNDEYILSTTYRSGGKDAENPRVEIEIFNSVQV